MCALQPPEIIDNGNALTVHWSNGRRAHFHAIWLRDNALDENTRSTSNGQRLITLSDIQANTCISAASIDKGELLVHFPPDNSSSRYPTAWLQGNRYDVLDRQLPGGA